MSDDELIKAWDMDGPDMMWWMRFLYDRHDDFVLLLTCADGTRYANFQHDWVEVLTQATSAFLAEAQRRRICRTDVGRRNCTSCSLLSGPPSMSHLSTVLTGNKSNGTAELSADCSTGIRLWNFM